MASVTTTQLNRILAYSRDYITRGFRTQQFLVSPLLSMITAKNRDGAEFGRPGSAALVGGSNLSPMRRQEILGTNQTTVRFQNGKVGGVKFIGTDGTTASTAGNALDIQLRSASFRTVYMQAPITVRGVVFDANKGPDSTTFGSYLEDSNKNAVEELNEKLAINLLIGTPSDRTEERWDNFDGLYNCCATTGTYGLNGDRGTYTTWASKRVTSAITAGVNLIDDANLVQGIKKRGPGIDVMVTTFPIYTKIKAEALALNGHNSWIRQGDIDAVKLGIQKEAVIYNGVIIVPDPYLQDYSNAVNNNFGIGDGPDLSKAAFGLTLGDFVFATTAADNWSVDPFLTPAQRGPGTVDALTSAVNLKARFHCERPWNQIVYTNVTA
jgi:hypothetical protein